MKDEGNELFKKDTDKGIEAYIKVNREIEGLFFLVTQDVDPYNPYSISEEKKNIIQNLTNLKKIIFSNLALGYQKKGNIKDSILNDQIVIQIDPYFEKSYIRLITNFKTLKDYENASKARDTMAYYIDKACLEKHQSIFKEIDEFLPKKQEIPQPQSNQQQNQKKEEIKVKDDKNSKPAKEVSDKNANSNKTKLSKKKEICSNGLLA